MKLTRIYAVVAQSVERFLGKEEVRQFKSAQQLQHKNRNPLETVGLRFFHLFVLSCVLFFILDLTNI